MASWKGECGVCGRADGFGTGKYCFLSGDEVETIEGMLMFPVLDQEKLEKVKRLIDAADYYTELLHRSLPLTDVLTSILIPSLFFPLHSHNTRNCRELWRLRMALGLLKKGRGGGQMSA